MATVARNVLTVQGQSLTIACAGQSIVGVALTGTWTGLVTFKVSYDGVNFQAGPATPGTVPNPTVTAVKTATANGNFVIPVINYAAVRVEFTTLTTGTLIVTAATSVDSSYQEAYLLSTSTFVEQDTAGGTSNTVTVAAQANRAWRCRTVSGGFSAAPAAAVKVTISDGASNILWAEYVAAAAGPWQLHLPADSNVPGISGGGVVNTAGNSLVITVAAPGGSVATSVSAEIIPA